MKILDVNVVLAAHRTDHPRFTEARAWIEGLAEANAPFSVVDLVAGSFIRIATNRRVFASPTPIGDAFAYIRALRTQPGHRLLAPSARHLEIFEGLCDAADAHGDLAPDAQLGAIAVEHGAEVISYDRDFSRFEKIRWSVPE